MKKKLLLFMLTAMAGSSYAQFPGEGFEAFPWPGNGPGPGWSIYQNNVDTSNTWRQTNSSASDEPAYEGSYAAVIQHGNVPASTVAQDWLVSPVITISPQTGLSFFSRFAQLGDQGGTYKVAVCPAGADVSVLSNYTVIQEWSEIQLNPLQLTYTQINIQFPPMMGGMPFHVAFIAESTQAENGINDKWIIDSINLGPVCPMPTELSVTDITSSSATLSWSAFNAQQWEVEVVPLSAPTTGIGELVNSTSYVVTDLDVNDYKFYVRTKCGENNYSMWAGPFFFTISNGITGVVRYDFDNDSDCDEDDIAVPSVEIQITVGTETYSVYTNENGEYGFYNMPGDATSVTMQTVAPNGFDTTAPITIPVDFTSDPDVEVDHCLGQADPVSDLTVSIVPISVARPGLQAHYDVIVRNMGTTDMATATVTVSFNDTKLDFVSAGGTNSVSGNVVTFTLNNLLPFSTHHLNLSMLVMTPPENIGGEILVFNGNVEPTQDDATPADNTTVLNQTIVNSLDPNDITVHEGAEIYEEQTDDYLNYTIRFQNMGTAEAIDIRVDNELDENLDWETFEPITSSHSYTVQREGNKVKFYYTGINLPYEEADEPGSHGFVTYRIKPKATYGLGDIVYNIAGIFFDFNDPVITNEVSTEVVQPTAGVKDNSKYTVALYPNPVKDAFTVQTANGAVSLIEVYDINGRLCISQTSGTSVNVSSLNNGLYFVKITTENGMTTKKIVKQ